jgi:hypothetical protein
MSTKRRGVVAPLLLMALIALLTAIPTFGQERESFDAHFYVLMASNDASKRSELPAPVDSAIRQFRESLPYRNYRLITTLVGRFRDRGALELSGVTPPNLIGPSNANRPVFYAFTLMPRAEPSSEPTRSINLETVRFGIRLPVIEGMNPAGPNTPATPILSYQSLELKTGISIREGVPAVVGSLTTGQPDEQLVLVLHVTKSP